MSAKYSLDRDDLKSALRHAIIALIAEAVTDSNDVIQSGADLATIGKTFAVALLAGVVRLATKWVSK